MAYCIQCGHKAERRIPEGDQKERWVCPSCHHIHYDNPKIICGALVIFEDKVLLCKRAIEPRYGYWTLPAGFMEIGETIAEGALRETVEEADAIAVNPHLYCIYDIPDIGQVYVLYLSELHDGKYGVGIESLECALFAEADIPWDDIAFEAVRRTLTHYFADRKQFADHYRFPVHQESIAKRRFDKQQRL